MFYPIFERGNEILIKSWGYYISCAPMSENWWDKLRNELDLYQEFREEMMKKKGDRFEMECQPRELTRLFEEWKKIRKR